MLGVLHPAEEWLVDLLKHTAMEAAAPLLGGRPVRIKLQIEYSY